MNTAPVYLCFTTWVQMRQFRRDRRLIPADIYLASGDHLDWIRDCGRRIVLVRSPFVAEGRDLERWQIHADAARRRNHENDYETEVLHVGYP